MASNINLDSDENGARFFHFVTRPKNKKDKKIGFLREINNGGASKLRVGFYSQTYPTDKTLIRQAFNADVQKTDDIDAHLLRMHFHDFFVRVILIDSANGNTAEKDAKINNDKAVVEMHP
ncbi:peroxidase 1-like [Zingiber officinale]|uniref:peroxidase 1-like n=1 Tax=Zingiber officinale TaxID=94328 RepID=UPI001C4CEF6B|nr:peroxidase 1-like [Zingiber officinale]